MGSRMPSSSWDWHSFFHLKANSDSSSISGMKFRAKAWVRPSVWVPTTNSSGTWMVPRSTVRSRSSCETNSSRTGR